MLIRKQLSLSEVALKFAGGADVGTFEGYASVFGGVDSQGDTILKGAFESTLRKYGQPKLYLEHAWVRWDASGAASLPIGLTECKEDDHGLFLRGELTPGMSLAAEVRAALKHGTVDGLSLGGFVKKGDYDETETGRIIRRWDRLLEVSVVAMPADSAARINSPSVKAAELNDAIDSIETIRDFERLLRDALGLSRGAAAALVARTKTMFQQPAGDPQAAQSMEQALQAAAQRLAQRAQRMAA